ncbi:hypothetical protein NSERUTF1_4418 [Nocardia seriolae]|nr:hypothetical protein NSERUTF1_4418 [Nocardia seriolae]
MTAASAFVSGPESRPGPGSPLGTVGSGRRIPLAVPDSRKSVIHITPFR